MSYYQRNGHDNEKQQLINENKMLLDRVDQMKNNFKVLEDMNMKLAERVKQQSEGMLSMAKEHEKYVQYCINNFNKQIIELTDKGYEWQKKAVSLEASLDDAYSEIGRLKRSMAHDANHLHLNGGKKRPIDASESEDSTQHRRQTRYAHLLASASHNNVQYVVEACR